MHNNINDYELIYLIRNNDEDSLKLMFKKYNAIVFNIAARYFNFYKRGDIDDYIQEGCVGLNHAINTFQEEKNVLFYTYACICIRTHIQSYCSRLMTNSNNFFYGSYSLDYDDLSLSDVIADNNSYTQDSYMIESDIKKIIIDFKNELEFNHSAVFELRYNGFKYREIAKLLDMPLRTVQGYMQRCKEKLKMVMNDCLF